MDIDTQDLIEAGALDAGCAGLWVELLDGPVPYWIESGSCGSSATAIWVTPAQLPEGELVGLRILWSTSPAPSAGDGSSVFPFFDDFDDFDDDNGLWESERDGGADIEAIDGMLETDGGVLLWSKQPVLGPDDEMVLRIAWSHEGPNMEIGAGTISDPGGLSSGPFGREWEGFVHTADGGGGGFAYSQQSPSCGDASSGGSQLFSTSAGESFVRAAVRWQIGSGGLSSLLDVGAQIDRGGDNCLTSTAPKPILLLPDEETRGDETDPTQRVDFVFVRPVAFEPSILNTDAAACALIFEPPETLPSESADTGVPAESGGLAPPHPPVPARETTPFVGCACASTRGPSPLGALDIRALGLAAVGIAALVSARRSPRSTRARARA